MNLSVSPRPAPELPQHLACGSVPSPYGPYEPQRTHGAAARVADTWLFCDPEYRHEMIAQAAYFRAKHRGFAPGHELEDWLAAEAQVDAELTNGPRL